VRRWPPSRRAGVLLARSRGAGPSRTSVSDVCRWTLSIRTRTGGTLFLRADLAAGTATMRGPQRGSRGLCRRWGDRRQRRASGQGAVERGAGWGGRDVVTGTSSWSGGGRPSSRASWTARGGRRRRRALGTRQP